LCQRDEFASAEPIQAGALFVFYSGFASQCFAPIMVLRLAVSPLKGILRLAGKDLTPFLPRKSGTGSLLKKERGDSPVVVLRLALLPSMVVLGLAVSPL